MRTDKIKQVICVSGTNPEEFQDRMNDALSKLVNPDIKFFNEMPFYAVITYDVKRDMPENVLELFEMIEGTSYTCKSCPYFIKSEDKRKKWGKCASSNAPAKIDSRACEQFYMYRFRVLSELKQQYLEKPYTVE